MFETQNSNPSAWERLGKLHPFILLAGFVIATPVAILFGIAPAVEGDFTFTKIIIPYSAILLFIIEPNGNQMFDLIVFGISAVQFLIYGVVISFAQKRIVYTLLVLFAHCIFVIAAFICGYFVGL